MSSKRERDSTLQLDSDDESEFSLALIKRQCPEIFPISSEASTSSSTSYSYVTCTNSEVSTNLSLDASIGTSLSEETLSTIEKKHEHIIREMKLIISNHEKLIMTEHMKSLPKGFILDHCDRICFSDHQLTFHDLEIHWSEQDSFVVIFDVNSATRGFKDRVAFDAQHMPEVKKISREKEPFRNWYSVPLTYVIEGSSYFHSNVPTWTDKLLLKIINKTFDCKCKEVKDQYTFHPNDACLHSLLSATPKSEVLGGKLNPPADAKSDLKFMTGFVGDCFIDEFVPRLDRTTRYPRTLHKDLCKRGRVLIHNEVLKAMKRDFGYSDFDKNSKWFERAYDYMKTLFDEFNKLSPDEQKKLNPDKLKVCFVSMLDILKYPCSDLIELESDGKSTSNGIFKRRDHVICCCNYKINKEKLQNHIKDAYDELHVIKNSTPDNLVSSMSKSVPMFLIRNILYPVYRRIFTLTSQIPNQVSQCARGYSSTEIGETIWFPGDYCLRQIMKLIASGVQRFKDYDTEHPIFKQPNSGLIQLKDLYNALFNYLESQSTPSA